MALKIFLELREIEEDLADYWDHDEFLFQGSDKFDKAMIERGFFQYGGTRRSHRYITEKFHNSTYDQVITSLTGLSLEDIEKKKEEYIRNRDIETLKHLIEKYCTKNEDGSFIINELV